MADSDPSMRPVPENETTQFSPDRAEVRQDEADVRPSDVTYTLNEITRLWSRDHVDPLAHQEVVEGTLSHIPRDETLGKLNLEQEARAAILETKAAENLINAQTAAKAPSGMREAAWQLFRGIKERLSAGTAVEKDSERISTELIDHLNTLRDWMQYMGESGVSARILLSRAAYLPLLLLSKVNGLGMWDTYKASQDEWWLLRTSRHLMTDRWGSIPGGKKGLWRVQDMMMTAEGSSFFASAEIPQNEAWKQKSQIEQMACLVYAKLQTYCGNDERVRNFQLDDKTDTVTVGFWHEGKPYHLPFTLSELRRAEPAAVTNQIAKRIQAILQSGAPPTVELGTNGVHLLEEEAYKGRHLLSSETEKVLKADLHVQLDPLPVEKSGRLQVKNERQRATFVTGGSLAHEALRFGVDDQGSITQAEVKVAHSKQQGGEASRNLHEALELAVTLTSAEATGPTGVGELRGFTPEELPSFVAADAEPLRATLPPEWIVDYDIPAEQFNRWNERIAELHKRGVKITLADLWNKAVMVSTGKTEIHTVASRKMEREYRGVKDKEVLSVLFDMFPDDLLLGIRQWEESGSKPPPPEALVRRLKEGVRLYNKLKTGLRLDPNQRRDLVSFMATMAGSIPLMQDLVRVVSDSGPMAGTNMTKAVCEPSAGMTSVTESRRHIWNQSEFQAASEFFSKKTLLRALVARVLNGETVAQAFESINTISIKFSKQSLPEGLKAFLQQELGSILKPPKAGEVPPVLDEVVSRVEQQYLQLDRAHRTTHLSTALTDIYLQEGAGAYALCPNGERGMTINRRATATMIRPHVLDGVRVAAEKAFLEPSATIRSLSSREEIFNTIIGFQKKEKWTPQELIDAVAEKLGKTNEAKVQFVQKADQEIRKFIEAGLKDITQSVDTLLLLLEAEDTPVPTTPTVASTT